MNLIKNAERRSTWRIEIFHDLEGWAKYLLKTAHFLCFLKRKLSRYYSNLHNSIQNR